jgi:hypothetical protein
LPRQRLPEMCVNTRVCVSIQINTVGSCGGSPTADTHQRYRRKPPYSPNFQASSEICKNTQMSPKVKAPTHHLRFHRYDLPGGKLATASVGVAKPTTGAIGLHSQLHCQGPALSFGRNGATALRLACKHKAAKRTIAVTSSRVFAACHRDATNGDELRPSTSVASITEALNFSWSQRITWPGRQTPSAFQRARLDSDQRIRLCKARGGGNFRLVSRLQTAIRPMPPTRLPNMPNHRRWNPMRPQ